MTPVTREARSFATHSIAGVNVAAKRCCKQLCNAETVLASLCTSLKHFVNTGGSSHPLCSLQLYLTFFANVLSGDSVSRKRFDNSQKVSGYLWCMTHFFFKANCHPI